MTAETALGYPSMMPFVRLTLVGEKKPRHMHRTCLRRWLDAGLVKPKHECSLLWVRPAPNPCPGCGH
jgi:hypothetical protein